LVGEESTRHFLIDNITPSAYKTDVDKDPEGSVFFLKRAFHVVPFSVDSGRVRGGEDR
jgi:hypothetical protein